MPWFMEESCSFSGSGKTAAFLLPIMNRIMQEGPYGTNYGVSYPSNLGYILISYSNTYLLVWSSQ